MAKWIFVCDTYVSYRFLDQGNEHKEPGHSLGTIMMVQAGGGTVAAAAASCITTPLDTIKTRLQVWIYSFCNSAVFLLPFGAVDKFLVLMNGYLDCMVRIIYLFGLDSNVMHFTL